jgi:adenylate kinase family enzyme
MKRIVIVGCAGSGKTALALRLGRETKLPVITLDTVWKRKLTRDDLPAFRALITKAHEGDSWISDGNFAVATFDIRLPRADLVVWLERSRLVCAWRTIIRVFSSNDLHGFRHLPKVLAFIWNFEQVNRPLIEAARLAHGPRVPVVRLAHDNAISDFVRYLRSRTG